LSRIDSLKIALLSISEFKVYAETYSVNRIIDTFPDVHSRKANKKSRKEVIHPQLPLRMPCYDFFPVTDPTLGPKRALPVLPASLKWRAVSTKLENVFTAPWLMRDY